MNMETIFKKEDFSLCEVPVPSGYPQSQTHCGIGILGNNFLMTTSPYPIIKYNKWINYFRVAVRKLTRGQFFKLVIGERYENPCIYVGDNSSGNPPIKFDLAQSAPLMGPLDPLYGYPSFNSDPDLYIEGDIVYVLNRSIYRMSDKQADYYMRLFLIEGKVENKRFIHYSTSLFREGKDIVGSQCMVKYRGQYILTDVMTNSYNDGITFNGIRLLKEDSMAALKTSTNWVHVDVEHGNLLPWHMSLLMYKDTLYTIIACVRKGEKERCWQMLGRFSDDLTSLKIYNTPLTDYSSYRGAACVTSEGVFVLYNTIVYETIKGSASVDGRDVIMAKMPINLLLDRLGVQ